MSTVQADGYKIKRAKYHSYKLPGAGDKTRFTGGPSLGPEYTDERIRERIAERQNVAHSLFSWHSRCAATPFDLSRLGYPLLDHVCNALHIANGAVSVRVGANEDGVPELVLDDSRRREIIRMHHAMEFLENNARNSE